MTFLEALGKGTCSRLLGRLAAELHRPRHGLSLDPQSGSVVFEVTSDW